MTQLPPTERFSSRVQDYVRYRPSYPQDVVEYLSRQGILTPASMVADIGSGTGLLTELFLRNGNTVYGVEPNADMRKAGEGQLRAYPRFVSINAAAEHTSLEADSIDLIIAGQAFHWFDRSRARAEFSRILRKRPHAGWVALIWNERVTTTPFLAAYEELLKCYSLDYSAVDHRQITEGVIAEFFRPCEVMQAAFANRQHFDFEGLRGRLLSSSYAPPAGHPQHAPMLAALAEIFRAHQSNNQVLFEYQTKLYTGQLSG